MKKESNKESKTETQTGLKLNAKRTVLIGFAFFGILMLWQVYYTYCPLYLRDLLEAAYGPGKYKYLIGIIMALDNLFALFMIPVFGMLSDKTKSKHGRRMPYIIAGTLLSFILFPLLAVTAVLNSLVWFLIVMVLLIISMGIYRSPAVSLMPDVTPKPLRSRANAIINFVGYVGAIFGTVLTMIFTYKSDVLIKSQGLTIIPFAVTAVLMLLALVMLLLKFKESRVVEEMRPEMQTGEELAETIEKVEEDKPLSRRDKANFVILISAVFLCFFAFNALNTFGTTFADEVLSVGTDKWGLASSALAIASLLTFLPSIKLTAKIGRKNSVLVGLGLIIAVMFAAGFVKSFGVLLIVLFAISGAGWAIINVNTYPMLVEMASRKNVGRYTGIYYIASQAAQCITSIVVGFVFDWLGMEVYFFYAVVFMVLAFILCLFFRTKKVVPSN